MAFAYSTALINHSMGYKFPVMVSYQFNQPKHVQKPIQ